MALRLPVASAALVGAMCGLGAMAFWTTTFAQTMAANASEFNGGWGRANGQENHSTALSLVSRDASGNREIVDGIIQTGASTVQARAAASGAGAAGYGGGGGGALAVGNSLTVVTQGDYNTVIVDATQVNNGDITAFAGVSGGVGQ